MQTFEATDFADVFYVIKGVQTSCYLKFSLLFLYYARFYVCDCSVFSLQYVIVFYF